MPIDPAKDTFGAHNRAAGDQPRAATAVTPSDSTDLSVYAKALYVGVSGDVVVLPISNDDGAPVTFKAHPVGYMPVQVRRVLATGTTATDILALSQ